MGNLSNRAIHEVFGCPTEAKTIVIEFSSSAEVVALEPNSLYRFAATEDCYIDLDSSGSVTAVTSDGVLIFGGVPEVFSTTGANYILAVIRKSADGDLHVTKMLNRGN
jgi:hypothetical protein